MALFHIQSDDNEIIAVEIPGNNLYSIGEIKYQTIIYDEGNALRLEMPEEESKIKSVFLAAVEFIQWHNNK